MVKLALMACLLLWTTAVAFSIKPTRSSKGLTGRLSTKLLSVSAEEAANTKTQLNVVDLCLCGAFATAFGDFVMHPIDTIKITQQTADVAQSMFGTLMSIVSKKGPLALYQGVVPYLIGDGLSGAVKFATFELSWRAVEQRLSAKYHAVGRFLCAAVAMLVCSIVLVPAEVLKTRLQAGSVSSLSQAISGILQAEGVRGFFAGYYATLVRDIPYTMLELGIYENLKLILRRLRQPAAVGSSGSQVNDELMAAAVTGGVTAFITTPLDLIKTKLMMQSTAGGQYTGVLNALTSLYRSSGLSALFVGAAARVAWLLPFTTIYLGVYEWSKRSLLRLKQPKTAQSTLP